MSVIVTRIAPSPTGPMVHLGNVRTLLYNYFLAKQNGGKFIVRLEDTDRDRYNPDFLAYFKEMCDWLGIVPDASYWNPDPTIGSFIQSQRDYSDKIKFLIDNGHAYYAFDTKADLDQAYKSNVNFKYDSSTRVNMLNSLVLSPDDVKARLDRGDKYVIRFAVPNDVNISYNDAILGDITINSSNLDDKVLCKSDGIASYHMANTADDHDMGVTHVLRGQEWISSTPFHILLYRAFGWEIPTFAHLPLIMNPDGKGKLSKRTSAKYGIPIAPLGYNDVDGNYIMGWKDYGYDADVFINTLSLIGWSPSNTNEILSMEDLIKDFSLDRVHKSGARFDIDKANHFNSYYLRNKRSDDDILKYIDQGDQYRYSDENLKQIIDLSKRRSVFTKDLQVVSDIFFKPVHISDDVKSSFTEDFKKVFIKFINSADSIEWVMENIKQLIMDISIEMDIKFAKLMPLFRIALCGGVSGPDLMTTASILGKSESVKRIAQVL